MSTLDSYLDINDYKIGPPPNWQDPKFWTPKGFFKKRKEFNYKLYINKVEDYIKRAHQRHWEDIEAYDNLSQERGEKSELMEQQLDQIMCFVSLVRDQVTEWADKWRLPASEYEAIHK